MTTHKQHLRRLGYHKAMLYGVLRRYKGGQASKADSYYAYEEITTLEKEENALRDAIERGRTSKTMCLIP